MRRHPNERLVCQASVLIAEKGSLTVGGLPVRQAIIDTGAHHVLIGKGLANQLKLDISGRTIERGILLMTAEGGEPKWMPKSRRPVEVVLLPGIEKECCIRLQCGVSESEDYDVQRQDLTEELEDWPWERYEEEYERRIKRRTLGRSPPDLKERVSRVQALDVPIRILELYGGIGTGLAAALRAGLPAAACYIDDVVVFSPNAAQHVKDVQATLDAVREAGLTCHPKKCSFGNTGVKYLGFEVQGGQLGIQQAKVEVLDRVPQPKDRSTLRAVLGFLNYYRKFIPNFSKIVVALNRLLREDQKWEWGEAE
ncbi:unnamed protein product [Closterium sp. NIES-54]